MPPAVSSEGWVHHACCDRAATALTQPDPWREASASLMSTWKDWVILSGNGKNWTNERQETGSSQQIISSPFLPCGLFWRLLGSSHRQTNSHMCFLMMPWLVQLQTICICFPSFLDSFPFFPSLLMPWGYISQYLIEYLQLTLPQAKAKCNNNPMRKSVLLLHLHFTNKETEAQRGD